MVRTQVQFAEEDLKELRREAAEEGVSVSKLVRRYVSAGLDGRRGPSREEIVRGLREVAGKYHSGTHDAAREHDKYLAEAYRR